MDEYEKFRVRQELEYKSDFDLQLDMIEEQAKKARGAAERGFAESDLTRGVDVCRYPILTSWHLGVR